MQRLMAGLVFGLTLTALIPCQAQDKSSPEGTWKRARDDGKSEYYVIEKGGDGGFTGERRPKIRFKFTGLDTRLKLTQDAGQLKGSIAYIHDLKDGLWSSYEKAPKAKWELKFSDKDTLTGRWEQLAADFNAKDQSKLVTARQWVDRSITRLPRVGGFQGVFEKDVDLPDGPKVAGTPLAAFAGQYALGDEHVRVSANGQDLSFQIGDERFVLKADDKLFKGQVEGREPACAVEMAVTKSGLVGRVQWHDYDADTKKAVHSGWSPISLERLVRTGPKDEAEVPSPQAGMENAEKLAGMWLNPEERVLLFAAQNGKLRSLQPVYPFQTLSLEDGLWIALERAEGMVLRWELSASAERLTGRRQCIYHRKGQSKPLASGWVAIEFTRPVHVGPKDTGKGATLTPNEALTMDALIGTWSTGDKDNVIVKKGEELVLQRPDKDELVFKMGQGVLTASQSLEGVELAWEMTLVGEELKARRQFKKLAPKSKKEVGSGWVLVELGRKKEEPKPEPEPEPEPEPTPEPKPEPEPEPVLFGFKDGEEAENLEANEGEKSSLVGTWKCGDGRYLTLEQTDDGGLKGTLKIGEQKYSVSLKEEGEFAKGQLQWVVGDQTQALNIELARPVGQSTKARLEWTLWNPKSGERVESKWVGLALKRLPRFG